jgi:hypothetical protein
MSLASNLNDMVVHLLNKLGPFNYDKNLVVDEYERRGFGPPEYPRGKDNN